MTEPYQVEFSRRAGRYVARLATPDKRRINERLRELARDPLSSSIPLTGFEGIRRTRVGDFRIVFRVDEAHRRLDVIRIGPRGDIYKDL